MLQFYYEQKALLLVQIRPEVLFSVLSSARQEISLCKIIIIGLTLCLDKQSYTMIYIPRLVVIVGSHC